MNIFTYITGIASLLGLILQIRDAFPKYRNLRKNLVLVILGIFIGSFLGSFRQIQVSLSTKQTSTEILALVIGVGSCIIISILAFGIIFIKDINKHELLGFSLVIVLLFFGIIIPLLSLGESFYEKNINLDELRILVDIHEKNKDYNRTIDLLEIMKSKIDNNDIRLESINNRLESLKRKQLGEATKGDDN